jgi:hypothetical protein
VRRLLGRRQDCVDKRKPREERPHRRPADHGDRGAAVGERGEKARAEKNVAKTLLGEDGDAAARDGIARPQPLRLDRVEAFAQWQRLLAPERHLPTSFVIGEALLELTAPQLLQGKIEPGGRV